MFLVSSALPAVAYWLVLYPPLVFLRPWTLVTYTFLHAGFMHIFFNMLGLFFFGPQLEARLGGKRFLWLYFLSGISGAVLHLAFTRFAPIPVVGASGAVFGVFLGFAKFWPKAQIYIWGVFPVQARWLVAFMTALALFGGFGGGGDGIAHFAHLGGFAGGWLYLKWLDAHSPQRRFQKKMYEHAKPRLGGEVADLARWRAIQRENLHEVNRDEVDRLMTKIEERGIASLSLQERSFLDQLVLH